jgi:hypothetical protein
MSQHASSSSQTIPSQSNERGDRDYTIPAGFDTRSIQGAIRAVKQFRKGQISKAEAILKIQASLTSGEVEPSNEELLGALSSYLTILDDIQEAARQDQPRTAGRSSRAPIKRAPKLTSSPSDPSQSHGAEPDPDIEFIPTQSNPRDARRQHSVYSESENVEEGPKERHMLSMVIALSMSRACQPHSGALLLCMVVSDSIHRTCKSDVSAL